MAASGTADADASAPAMAAGSIVQADEPRFWRLQGRVPDIVAPTKVVLVVVEGTLFEARVCTRNEHKVLMLDARVAPLPRGRLVEAASTFAKTLAVEGLVGLPELYLAEMRFRIGLGVGPLSADARSQVLFYLRTGLTRLSGSGGLAVRGSDPKLEVACEFFDDSCWILEGPSAEGESSLRVTLTGVRDSAAVEVLVPALLSGVAELIRIALGVA